MEDFRLGGAIGGANFRNWGAIAPLATEPPLRYVYLSYLRIFNLFTP